MSSITRDELKNALRKQAPIREKIRKHQYETAAAIAAIATLIEIFLR